MLVVIGGVVGTVGTVGGGEDVSVIRGGPGGGA